MDFLIVPATVSLARLLTALFTTLRAFESFCSPGGVFWLRAGTAWPNGGFWRERRGAGSGGGRLTQVPCGYGDLRKNAERGNLSAFVFTRRSRGSRPIKKAPR